MATEFARPTLNTEQVNSKNFDAVMANATCGNVEVEFNESYLWKMVELCVNQPQHLSFVGPKVFGKLFDDYSRNIDISDPIIHQAYQDALAGRDNDSLIDNRDDERDQNLWALRENGTRIRSIIKRAVLGRLDDQVTDTLTTVEFVNQLLSYGELPCSLFEEPIIITTMDITKDNIEAVFAIGHHDKIKLDVIPMGYTCDHLVRLLKMAKDLERPELLLDHPELNLELIEHCKTLDEYGFEQLVIDLVLDGAAADFISKFKNNFSQYPQPQVDLVTFTYQPNGAQVTQPALDINLTRLRP